jgi:hypothetical protein
MILENQARGNVHHHQYKNDGIVLSNTRHQLEWKPSPTIRTRNLTCAETLFKPARITLQTITQKHLRLSDSPPYAPSTYPAGAPAVHGSLPGSELLAADWLPSSEILALDSGWLPGSDLPTCYPACSRAVCKRKTHYLIPRAFTRLGFTAAYPALSFWLQDFGSRLRLVTRLQPPKLLPGVPLSGLQTQDPLPPYTPSIYPAGTPAGVHGSLPGSNLPTCYPESSRVVCKRKTHYLIPRAFTRLVRPLGFTAAYPAPRFWLIFWLSTPAGYPAPTSQLVTWRPLEWSANARPYLIPRALTRLVRPLGFTAAYSAPNFWLPTPDWLPGSDLPTAKRNALNHARELTHPAPGSMPRGSLFLGLPISGCQAAATYSAGGPVGPTLQASTWVGEQVQYAFA